MSDNKGPEQYTSTEKQTARFGRLAGGVVGIVIGIVLLFKGEVAAYLPIVGVLFILTGIAVILLAVRYARRS